jgi:hypothetical protein
LLFATNSLICKKSSEDAHIIIVADAITSTRLNLLAQGIVVVVLVVLVVVLNFVSDSIAFPLKSFTPILLPNFSHKKKWENIPPTIATSETIKGHLINPSRFEVTATVWTD